VKPESENSLVALFELVAVNPPVQFQELREEDPVSFIPMEDVSDSGRWYHRQERKLREVWSGYTAFQERDILFAKITPCMENGKGMFAADLTNHIGFGSTEFHVLRPRGDNDGRFLYHWLQSKTARNRALAFMGGSAGQQRVQAEFFHRFKIPFFSPPEQRRIAFVLDTIDEAITQTEVVIAKLKQVHTGLLHDLLTRGLDENGELRDPIAHPEQFEDSPVGRIPKGWEIDTLGRFCASGNGSIQTGPFGSELHAGDYVEQGMPIITVEHLIDSRISHLNVPKVDAEDYQRLIKYRLETGDLVFSRVGAIDRCSIVTKKENGWLFSGRCLRVRPGSLFNPYFQLHQLNFYRSSRWILANAVGSTMKCLNTTILSRVPIVRPEKQEQDWIAERLLESEQSVESETVNLSKLMKVKSGLMSDLLTGRVRVPESVVAQLNNDRKDLDRVN
jgi:type I restriction enzyme S subunit